MQPVTYEAVYYVHTEEKSVPLNPIGIKPRIQNGKAWWDDTTPGRGRSFRITNVEMNQAETPPKKIEITTDDGKKVTLTYLTLDVYNKNVREKVVGKLNFNSDQEVQAYYLTTDFSL